MIIPHPLGILLDDRPFLTCRRGDRETNGSVLKSPRGSMRSNASAKPRANSVIGNGGIAGSFGEYERTTLPCISLSASQHFLPISKFLPHSTPPKAPNMALRVSCRHFSLSITLTVAAIPHVPPSSLFSAPLAAFTDDLPDEDEERSGGDGGVDACDMEAGEGGGNLHKDLQSGPLRGSQQNLYPDINVIPPSRSRSPSASKSSERKS